MPRLSRILHPRVAPLPVIHELEVHADASEFDENEPPKKAARSERLEKSLEQIPEIEANRKSPPSSPIFTAGYLRRKALATLSQKSRQPERRVVPREIQYPVQMFDKIVHVSIRFCRGEEESPFRPIPQLNQKSKRKLAVKLSIDLEHMVHEKREERTQILWPPINLYFRRLYMLMDEMKFALADSLPIQEVTLKLQAEVLKFPRADKWSEVFRKIGRPNIDPEPLQPTPLMNLEIAPPSSRLPPRPWTNITTPVPVTCLKTMKKGVMTNDDGFMWPRSPRKFGKKPPSNGHRVFFGDSNVNYPEMTELGDVICCRGAEFRHLKRLLEPMEAHIQDARQLIIHVGINDLCNEEISSVTADANMMFRQLFRKFPRAKIYYLTVAAQKENGRLYEKIVQLNRFIRKEFPRVLMIKTPRLDVLPPHHYSLRDRIAISQELRRQLGHIPDDDCFQNRSYCSIHFPRKSRGLL